MPGDVLPLEGYRDYLTVLAGAQLRGPLRGRLRASDVVQQTLLRAHQQADQFRGTTSGELAKWLRRILARQLANAARDLQRDCRDVRRERPLEEAVEESSVRLEAWLAAEQSSPSERAERNEQVMRLAAALAALPEAQREAVALRYLQG